ncbi:MAG: hypothetical protein ACUVXI_03110 [bacterium]
METIEKGIVERVDDDIIRIPADVSLGELYAELSGYELCVEPLSAKRPLGDFIAEGGLGYNSLREGRFASKVCRIETRDFAYGAKYSTLYNVGYPLHRIIEGSSIPSAYRNQLPEIQRMSLFIRPRAPIRALYNEANIENFFAPREATNSLFVNDFGASLFGLKRGGMIATYPPSLAPEGGVEVDWGRRFVEDEIPPGQSTIKVLTQRSGLAKLYEAFGVAEGLFLALFVEIGVLVVMSADGSKLAKVDELLETLPLTFQVGKTMDRAGG